MPQMESPIPFVRDKSWKNGWRECLLRAFVRIRVLERGESMLIKGPPGCGKTYFLRGLIADLRAQKKRVDIICKTHLSVQNVGSDLGAVTADHYVHRHFLNGGIHCDVLVVDEITQINVQIWQWLCLAKFKNIQMILVGDFQQFGPVCENFCGSPVPEDLFEKSDMLYEMCDGQMLNMEYNKRSDPNLFNFFTRLTENLAADIERAKALFPKIQRRKVDYYLTMSHQRRVQLNRLANISAKPPGAIELKAPKSTRSGNNPQDMWVYPKQQLVGFGGLCKKGLFVEVESVGPEKIKSTNGVELLHDSAVRCLRLAHALTYASVQGLTLKGVVQMDTDSPNFTHKHMYVGMSRCTSSDLLQVV
jgi:hypothetical protein